MKTIDLIGEGRTVSTPWGKADFETVYAPGIVFYSTPSHGGFKLAHDRLAAVRAKFPTFKPCSDRWPWFEEDCDWSAVALTFPEVFPDVAQAEAQSVFDRYCKH